MGKLTNEFFNGFSGKIGNLLFYQVRGETLVRRKPGKRNSPTTMLQTYHQQAFALVLQFLSPMKNELKIGFGEFEKGAKRGIDRAKSLMLKNAILPADGVPIVVPEKVKVSSGDLTPVKGGLFTKLEDGKFRIDWEQNSWDGSARDSDKTFVVVYDSKERRVFSVQGAAYRRDGRQLVEMPWTMEPSEAGTSEVFLYFSFYADRGNSTVFSDSVCLGKL